MTQTGDTTNLLRKVLIFGGTGFLGMACANHLTKQGFNVIIVSRKKPTHQYASLIWDGENHGDWSQHLERSEVVINFAGKSINCVHNANNRKGILDSRIKSVQVLNEAILECKNPPKLFIQAGSLARFNNGNNNCNESSPTGNGFTADVSIAWEDAFYKTQLPATRKVNLRIGIVLSQKEGAFAILYRAAKFFVGGTAGKGNQQISWIHISDFLKVIDWVVNKKNIDGSFNTCNPHPCSNQDLMKAVRKTANRPWSPPAPKWLIKFVSTYFLKTDPSLALDSISCIPEKLESNGFQFEYDNIDDACNSFKTERD